MTAKNSDEIRVRAVIVGNGSGVAVPAMTNEYCYVLTAAHNLRRDPDDPNTIKDLSEISVQFADGVTKAPEFFAVAHDEDAAVILIKGMDFAPILYSHDDLDYRDEISLVGYPNTRRANEQNSIRLFNGRIEDIQGAILDISTHSFSSQSEIIGVSGGGVYRRVDHEWLLVGIEYSMEGKEGEDHGWLKCVRMNVFEKIVENNSYLGSPLVPILPPFLANFSLLIESSFQIAGLEDADTQEAIRAALIELAYESIKDSCPTPHALMKKFGDRLLISNDPIYRLSDKKLWTSWVELLVFSIIIDGGRIIDNEYIDELRRTRRLLYSGTMDEWMTLLRKILHSNLQGIDEGGLVFVSTNCSAPPAKHRTTSDLSKIVKDIGRPRSARTDIGSPTKISWPRALVHLEGLHAECFARKEEKYKGIGEMEIPEIVEIIRNICNEAIA